MEARKTDGCDLLEISYLCGRLNNRQGRERTVLQVVICSKFPTFVVDSTTVRSQIKEGKPL